MWPVVGQKAPKQLPRQSTCVAKVERVALLARPLPCCQDFSDSSFAVLGEASDNGLNRSDSAAAQMLTAFESAGSFCISRHAREHIEFTRVLQFTNYVQGV